jgi:hypothetical protein
LVAAFFFQKGLRAKGGRVSAVGSELLQPVGRTPAIPSGHLPIRRVRVALLGYGRVGQALARLIDAECAKLREEGSISSSSAR